MKLIMRADDLGYSEGINCGIVKTVKDGLITCVGIMTNMEKAKQGYQMIKDFDIAIGQHTNICEGKCVADPSLIPNLVKEDGSFYSSHELKTKKMDDICVEEYEIEIEAQLKRFQEITGKDPDYLECHAVFSKHYFRALRNVAKKHRIFYENPLEKDWQETYHIYSLPFLTLDQNGLYDPRHYFEENLEKIKNQDCSVAVFHPGYLDQYVLTHSSYTLIRPLECDFLCKQWLKEWVKENHIQLTDFREYHGYKKDSKI